MGLVGVTRGFLGAHWGAQHVGDRRHDPRTAQNHHTNSCFSARCSNSRCSMMGAWRQTGRRRVGIYCPGLRLSLLSGWSAGPGAGTPVPKETLSGCCAGSGSPPPGLTTQPTLKGGGRNKGGGGTQGENIARETGFTPSLLLLLLRGTRVRCVAARGREQGAREGGGTRGGLTVAAKHGGTPVVTAGLRGVC